MGPHKKHRRSSTSSSSSSSDNEELKRKRRKKKHSKKKRQRRDSSSDSGKKPKLAKKSAKTKPKAKTEEASADIPLDLMDRSKSMAPMTKEEWEKRQSVVRKVYDETTGRHRLIKGDGEVIEEIVSRDRHKAINRQATQGDGTYFQSQTTKNTL